MRSTTHKGVGGAKTKPEQGLHNLGYVEEQNILLDYRYAEDQPDRLPALVAELVQLAPDVIWLHSDPAVWAAKRATTTIPIVFGVALKPVEQGLVASLARPAGNLTGLEFRGIELAGKRPELFKEQEGGNVVMKFAHFAHVWNKAGMSPAQRYQQLWRELQVADALGFDYGFCVEHHFRPDESWMSAPNLYTVAAAARTRQIRLGAMGHIVPLHHPLRLAEEIALTDQMVEGRLEVGLVPGILPDYFGPFGVDYQSRREVTMEFVGLLRRVYTDAEHFDFEGQFHHFKHVKLAVNPLQRPHPPLWLETRDPETLAFCAKEGLNTGYFLLFPREAAAPRYRTFLAQWRAAGWQHRPNIAYSTVVYIDETDDKALQTSLRQAGRAYRGLFPLTTNDAELQDMQNKHAAFFEARGEPGAAEIVRHLVDPDYLLSHDLILLGSPATVVKKLKAWAIAGVFNTFFGEFNFGDLAEEDLLRSIRLFGTEVIPQLRDFEPF